MVEDVEALRLKLECVTLCYVEALQRCCVQVVNRVDWHVVTGRLPSRLILR